ncbi:MAG: glycosyltransferase [Oscillospiraceae bacterium]|nr:glycosyltransferase [Oscillospiraceae bacterium]
MKESRVVFVILHYLAGKDTVECIESIKRNIEYNNKYIVVVDNASNNGSCEMIQEKYEGDTEIVVIKNEENLGFAKGNNVGFMYAKNILKARFIVLLNNDTIIRQKSFCDLLISKYKERKYYVLGPDIITRDGYHQNPLKHRNWTLGKLKLFKIKAQIRLLDRKLLAIGPRLLKKKQKVTAAKTAPSGDCTSVRLHGSCLIFSPDYIKKFDGLNPGTFLYMEEDLLQIEMDAYNYSMWYSGDLEIFHKEDVSTKMLDATQKDRDIRFLKNLINSIDVCIKSIKK